MTFKLPSGCKVGSIIEVAWDVEASFKRSGNTLLEGFYEARILELAGSLCKLHFDYNPPDGVYKGPMEEDITIDLSIGVDQKYGGVIDEIRKPIRL